MTHEEFTLDVAAANGSPRRLAVLQHSDGGAWRDYVDPNSGNSRRRFIQGAKNHFGHEGGFDWLEPRIVAAADAADEAADEAARDGADGRSTTDLLVELALGRWRFGQTQADEPFAVEVEGPNIAIMFRGSRDSLRSILSREFRRLHGRTPNSAALSDALTTLQGEALVAAKENVYLRVAVFDSSIVLDLGGLDGRAVVIERGAWRIVDRSPVLFRRTAATGCLPAPEHSGSLDQLRALLNFSDDTWPLVVGWLITCFLPDIPHPILLLGGQQGSGKTTAAQKLVGLIDPSPADLRSQPRDPETWAITAAASWVVVVDNISTISEWWSDSLCKAVTGDGWIRRKLYTDGELAVVAFRRVIMLTSIDPGALRGDLGDRVLMVDLEPINEMSRRTDQEIAEQYQQLRPQILGALLDLLADALALLQEVQVDRLPRMADFAKVLAAVDRAAGFTDNSSFEKYLAQGSRIAATVIESDSVAMAVEELMQSEGNCEGTATELLERLTPDKPPKGWPRTPQDLGGRLKRLMPALKQAGIQIEYRREGHQRTRTYRLIREVAEVSCDQPSASSAMSAQVVRRQNSFEATRTAEDDCGQTAETARSDVNGGAQSSSLIADNADNALQMISTQRVEGRVTEFRGKSLGQSTLCPIIAFKPA